MQRVRHRCETAPEKEPTKVVGYRSHRKKWASLATSVSPSVVRITEENVHPGLPSLGCGQRPLSRHLLSTKSISSREPSGCSRRSPTSIPSVAGSLMANEGLPAPDNLAIPWERPRAGKCSILPQISIRSNRNTL